MNLFDLKNLKAFIANRSFLKLVFLGLVLLIVFKNLPHRDKQMISRQEVLPMVSNIPVSSYVPTVKVSGFLKPGNIGTVKANFKAVVKKNFIHKGRPIKKGDIILELKSEEIEKRLMEAKARYEHKRAESESYQKLSKNSFASQNEYLSIIADLEQVKANLQKAETDSSELIVRALGDGYLEECYVHEGDTVFAQDKLVHIVYPDSVYIRSYVSEEIIGKLKIGMEVRVNVGANEFIGKIYGLSKVADSNTRSFYVDTIIENADHLNYGVTAEVTLMLPERKGFWVNASALTLDDNGILGVKILKDSKVCFLPVNLGSMKEDGAYIECDGEVLSLIVHGGEFLLPGQSPKVAWQKNSVL